MITKGKSYWLLLVLLVLVVLSEGCAGYTFYINGIPINPEPHPRFDLNPPNPR